MTETSPAAVDELFSKTPPTEPGFYWLEWTPNNYTVAQFTGEHWWLLTLARKVETNELVESEWHKFGPKIETPAQCIARAAWITHVKAMVKSAKQLLYVADAFLAGPQSNPPTTDVNKTEQANE